MSIFWGCKGIIHLTREDITSHAALKDGFQIIADETCETCIPSPPVEEVKMKNGLKPPFPQ
jgi:hypothetical protein